MHRFSSLTISSFAIFATSVALPSAGAPTTSAARAQGQVWSTCFAKGPAGMVYVSGVLPPPWTQDIPVAFAAFVARKYSVTTPLTNCVNAVSEAKLAAAVKVRLASSKYVTLTGWTMTPASPATPPPPTKPPG